MSLLTRSATIQVRVVPVVKRASEEVLWRLGLTMSQAVELFLRRIIVDERIPFDVAALEIDKIVVDVTAERGARGAAGVTEATEATKKEFKKFLGAPTPGQIQARKATKKPRN